jgi:hypothetical protein
MISFMSVGSDMPKNPTEDELCVLNALTALVNQVFCFNGKIKDVDYGGQTSTIRTSTLVPGHVVFHVFIGPSDEMKLLMSACAFYLDSQLTGQPFARAVYMNLMGPEAEQHEKALIGLSDDDLAAVAVMVHEGLSLDEVLAAV